MGRAQHDRGRPQHLLGKRARSGPGSSHHAHSFALRSRKMEPARYSIFSDGHDHLVTVSRSAAGEFVGSSQPPFDDELQHIANSDGDDPQNASLYASVYLAGLTQKLPAETISKVLSINAFDTDFRRRVRPGDTLEMFFDMKDDQVDRWPARRTSLHGDLERRRGLQILPLPLGRRRRRLLRRGRQQFEKVSRPKARSRRRRAPHVRLRRPLPPVAQHAKNAHRRRLGLRDRARRSSPPATARSRKSGTRATTAITSAFATPTAIRLLTAT